MSAFQNMLPVVFVKNLWDLFEYVPRIMGQGSDSDLQKPHSDSGRSVRSRTEASMAASGFSEVDLTGDEFRIKLDTSHFKREEVQVKVKVGGKLVVVHGKHEERASDGGGTVEREFTRRYMLPEDCDGEDVDAGWDREGALIISAPIRKGVAGGRTVPIQAAQENAEKTVPGTKKSAQATAEMPDQAKAEKPQQTATEAVKQAFEELTNSFAMKKFPAYTEEDVEKAKANASLKFRQAIEENPLEASIAFIQWGDMVAIDKLIKKADKKFAQATPEPTQTEKPADEKSLGEVAPATSKKSAQAEKSVEEPAQAFPEKPIGNGEKPTKKA